MRCLLICKFTFIKQEKSPLGLPTNYTSKTAEENKELGSYRLAKTIS